MHRALLVLLLVMFLATTVRSNDTCDTAQVCVDDMETKWEVAGDEVSRVHGKHFQDHV